ncbi:MAG TPA: hypothetical protein VFE05_19795 [Longimicrobiaceae bacterium]|jgi:hypothetical protein|nr:hypothetical protein [Longimicrobiaceae bacterium]
MRLDLESLRVTTFEPGSDPFGAPLPGVEPAAGNGTSGFCTTELGYSDRAATCDSV